VRHQLPNTTETSFGKQVKPAFGSAAGLPVAVCSAIPGQVQQQELMVFATKEGRALPHRINCEVFIFKYAKFTSASTQPFKAQIPSDVA
jgi:hypothetical protein